MKTPITPRQALREILGRSFPLGQDRLSLERGWGRILKAPVYAPFSYPRFDNAALDGYALRSRDSAGASAGNPMRLALMGRQFAGQAWKGRLGPGGALHVTTGAPMPRGSDALVPYELARLEGRGVFLDAPVERGWNVRRRGEDGLKGVLLARRGELLNARRLAMLAAFGVKSVVVAAKPRVAMAGSGDERLRTGAKMRPGSVFDANGPALRGLLRENGLEACADARLPDRETAMRARIKALLGACDVLLVAGGMSVGGHDLAKSVLESLGVRRVFWRVAQKPGKPLYFGTLGRRLVFGLPGNPA
ncbi:MAG: molybdopterin molybdotransferase MoeA, partial [bacterium]